MTAKLNLCWLVGLCGLLMACGRLPPLTYWQTDETPTDKPVVNYVVSQNAEGEFDLAQVTLRVGNPSEGGLQERGMAYVVTRRTKEKITFELEEDPGRIVAITFPPTLGKSFEAECSGGGGSSRPLVFRQIKR